MCKEILSIVEKANSINTDYRGKCKDLLCLSCEKGCISFEFILNGKCEHYKHRMSLVEINSEIRSQNINLRKICKEYSLKYGIMKDMLSNKIALSWKYYHILELRINEKNEYLEYIERFNGDNNGE